eukprot:g4121.t1
MPDVAAHTREISSLFRARTPSDLATKKTELLQVGTSFLFFSGCKFFFAFCVEFSQRVPLGKSRTLPCSLDALDWNTPMSAAKGARVLVLGAGTGGCAVASRLTRLSNVSKVTMVDPAQNHFYQPLWTLVGGGLCKAEWSQKPMQDVIPRGVEWIKDSVKGFIPEKNQVEVASGKVLDYDYLVVAMGLRLNYDAIPGLVEALESDKRVCSNYHRKYVEKTYPAIQAIHHDHSAIFTMPPMPIKCAGAPQKIMWIAQDIWSKQNIKPKIYYNTALGVMFGVKKYSAALTAMLEPRGITANYQHVLCEVDAANSTAKFKKADGSVVSMKYDLLHATPPQGPLEVLKTCPLADQAGWVAVDKKTLQHIKFPNIFSLGDCSSLPTSKTAAAVASENYILVSNLQSVMEGKQPTMEYDGYTSCPLVTHTDKNDPYLRMRRVDTL